MSEFFNTTSSPNGHGFSRNDAATGFACYTFEPKSGIPIRVIVLDDTQSPLDPVDPGSPGYGHGTLDENRYDWLVSELERGKKRGGAHDNRSSHTCRCPAISAGCGREQICICIARPNDCQTKNLSQQGPLDLGTSSHI